MKKWKVPWKLLLNLKNEDFSDFCKSSQLICCSLERFWCLLSCSFFTFANWTVLDSTQLRYHQMFPSRGFYSSISSDGFSVHSGPSHFRDWPLGSSATHDRYIRPVPPFYVTEYEASYTWPQSALIQSAGNGEWGFLLTNALHIKLPY
jgi:hypothetical protein